MSQTRQLQVQQDLSEDGATTVTSAKKLPGGLFLLL
jgi:hypothetical protein